MAAAAAESQICECGTAPGRLLFVKLVEGGVDDAQGQLELSLLLDGKGGDCQITTYTKHNQTQHSAPKPSDRHHC